MQKYGDLCNRVPKFWQTKLVELEVVYQSTIDFDSYSMIVPDSENFDPDGLAWFQYAYLKALNIEEWDWSDHEGDHTRYLQIIDEMNLVEYPTEIVFASYMRSVIHYNVDYTLVIDEFMKRGIEESALGNVLAIAAEYRDLDQMEALLKAGANPNRFVPPDKVSDDIMKIIDFYLYGHSVDYTTIKTDNQFRPFMEGLKLLTDYGATINRESFESLGDLFQYNPKKYTRQILKYLKDFVVE